MRKKDIIIPLQIHLSHHGHSMESLIAITKPLWSKTVAQITVANKEIRESMSSKSREMSREHGEAIAAMSRGGSPKRWQDMVKEMEALAEALRAERQMHREHKDHQSANECREAFEAIKLAVTKISVVAG